MLSSNEEIMTTSDESSLSFDQQEFFSNKQRENDRINALKNLQISYNQLESHYLKSVHELEYKFHEQCSYLFEQRSDIINGKHEPTDDECQLKTDFIEINERSLPSNNQLGIPSFWLQTLKQVRLKTNRK
jgi:nucleosome assembly protein 1-like 1